MSVRHLAALMLAILIGGCGAAPESDAEGDEEEDVDTTEEAIAPVCWTNVKTTFYGCTAYRTTCVGQYETTVNYSYSGNC